MVLQMLMVVNMQILEIMKFNLKLPIQIIVLKMMLGNISGLSVGQLAQLLRLFWMLCVHLAVKIQLVHCVHIKILVLPYQIHMYLIQLIVLEQLFVKQLRIPNFI